MRYHMDVRGVSRDGQISIELDTDFLRQAIGILALEDFRIIVNTEWVRMTLNVASLNVRRLRDPSKCARLLGEFSNFCVNVAAMQETHFTYTEDCRVLEGDFVVFSAFGSCCIAEVSLLVGCSLNAIVSLILADEFRVVAVYAPNSISKRHSFFSNGWDHSLTI